MQPITKKYNKVTVKCACGNAFDIMGVIKQSTMKVELCHKCHPVFTGKNTIVDTEGKVDKFNKKFGSLSL